MVKLAALKHLMQRNGMCYQPGRQAASLEIVPFGDDLFDPNGTLNQDQPSQPPAQEGGSCQTCAGGCQSCQACEAGCTTTCAVTCKSSSM